MIAKLNLFDAALCIPALWWAIKCYGIHGALAVCFLRAFIDATAMFVMACKILPEIRPSVKRLALAVSAAFLSFGLASVQTGLAFRGAIVALTMFVFVGGSWLFALDGDEREFVRRSINIVGKGGPALTQET